MPDPIIEARSLHAYYGTSHILHGIDFAIRPGEAVALMGRNGMGKTTLIRCLTGHLPPREGVLLIDGRLVTRPPPHRLARQGLAYVPEGRGIFGNLTVRENLVMAARPAVRGLAGWNLQDVLRMFPRLAERLSHGGEQLSGGEQQMLAIGRALMTNPRLLFLDEATEGLAPLVAQQIWHIIGRIRESGIAAVIVDKNFAAVTAHTDRCVILVKGRIIFEGSSAALAARPELRREHLGI
jgi:branched-chain amino acid transport system ATP-binding protein